MIAAAASSSNGLASLRLVPTACQSRFRPKNQKIKTVRASRIMNLRYLRKVSSRSRYLQATKDNSLQERSLISKTNGLDRQAQNNIFKWLTKQQICFALTR